MLVKLLRAFDPSRLRHCVITLRSAGALSALLPDHVACRALDARGRSQTTALRLAGTVRRSQACVLHARNTGCWADATTARLLAPRCRLILGFHGLEHDGGFSAKQTRWAGRAQRLGASFTSVSLAGRDQLREQAHVADRRITLLRNGIDTPRLGVTDPNIRRRTRAEFGFDDTSFVVGAVGSLTPVKGHSVLIEAVKQLAARFHSVRLLLVGDGPLHQALIQQAAQAGIGDRVRLAGRRDNIPSLLAAMDAFACSSLSEGMSNALLEAMASGLPVVATDVGDNAVVVRDGTDGLIVPAGSADAIQQALATLVRDHEVRERLAKAARTRAASFDFDQTVRAYEAYYLRLSRDRAAPGAGTVVDGRHVTVATQLT